ncbi:hypothetical protein DFS33DRAFT_1383875 [Desarmillaria ectypa]|nr:hypothetical protein DFS33DRAFT_1383875 [Desarmillaria ectypa]
MDAADAIITHHTPTSEENVDVTQITDVFLQTWKTSTARLPEDLKTLLKTAQKYNVCLHGSAFSQEILCGIPIWYHAKSQATMRMYNGGEQVKCLKIRHKIQAVGDAEKLAQYLCENRHTERGRCSCEACKHAREQLGCMPPRKCFQKARSMLDSLPPNWNPLMNLPAGRPNEDNRNEDQDEGRTHSGYSRIQTNAPTVYSPERAGQTKPQQELESFMEKETSGTGAFGSPNEVGRTNQVSELVGAKSAAEDVPVDSAMELMSDSRHVLDGLGGRFIK